MKNRHDWQVNLRAGVLYRTFTSQKLEVKIYSVCAKTIFSSGRGKKTSSFYIPRPPVYAPMPLCLGFIAANAAAGEAVRMAARARRARQFVGKEILRCYQWILLLYRRPGSSEVPRNPLTRWDVSSIPAKGIFLTKATSYAVRKCYQKTAFFLIWDQKSAS